MTAIAPEYEYTEFNDVEYTNICQCGWCPTCEMGTWGIGEPCAECGTKVEPDEDCSGCFEDEMNNLRPYFNMWLDGNDSPCGMAIVSTGLTWASGRTPRVLVVPTDALRSTSYPTDWAAVDSEWTQVWTLQPRAGGECHVVTYHHDAPTGAPVTLHPMIGCLDENDEF